MKSYYIPILRNFLVKFPAVTLLSINFLIANFTMHPNTHLHVLSAKSHYLHPICWVFISLKTMTPFLTYYHKRGLLMSAYLKHVLMLTVVDRRYVLWALIHLRKFMLWYLILITNSLIDIISVLDCRRAKATLHWRSQIFIWLQV